MIVQVSEPVKFTDASRIAVPLLAPSAAQSTIALVVTMTGLTCALRVSDNLGGRPRWRMPNDPAGACTRWYRVPGPHAGVQEIVIETTNRLEISGIAIAAEVAGCSPGDAVQALDDLLAEAGLE